jgi:hypothetical protein
LDRFQLPSQNNKIRPSSHFHLAIDENRRGLRRIQGVLRNVRQFCRVGKFKRYLYFIDYSYSFNEGTNFLFQTLTFGTRQTNNFNRPYRHNTSLILPYLAFPYKINSEACVVDFSSEANEIYKRLRKELTVPRFFYVVNPSTSLRMVSESRSTCGEQAKRVEPLLRSLLQNYEVLEGDRKRILKRLGPTFIRY